jgi:hypothetical protein
MKTGFQKFIPYSVAVVLFLVVAFAYFPDVIQGKKLNQHDVQTYKGSAKEILDYKEKTGEHSLWTNSLFGGMPSYMVANYAPSNINKYIYDVIDFNHKIRPVSFIFLALIGFFIALLLFEVNPWLSIAGAFAFAFSSYFLIIIEAGHITKVIALGFMPPIIAGVYYAYNKKALIGTIVLMVFLAMQLLVNHLQITYYTLLIILIYLIFELVKTLRKKTFKSFIKTSLLLFVGALIAVSTNFSQLVTAYDYGKDSTRGKSELTIDKNNQTSGLDKDYATDWSYGKLETLNLLIPNLVGGASMGELTENSEMYKELKKMGVQNPKKIIERMPTYWGPQPFTSGPVYLGAIIVFLFVFGLFLVKGNLKWWLLSVTVFSILLAWGKNFMFLTDFFLDYFPGYNKFRTVSMILVIAQFSVPILAILSIKNMMDKKVSKAEIYKALKWAGGIVGGIVIILLINPGILSFKGEDDAGLFRQMFGLNNDPQYDHIINTFTSAIESDRASIFRADALRTLIFIAFSVALIWLFAAEKLKQNGLIAALGILILVDLWAVDKRYLNSDDFVSARVEKVPFAESFADNFILKDKETYFRVLNLTVSTFNDASTSYFHKSVGGYHGAKMKRYQELITYVMSEELGKLYNAINVSNTETELYASLMNLPVINMLNTKYFILNPDMLPMTNQYRLGNAWFVNNIKEVNNADEEISALRNFDPAQSAIIDKKFRNQFFKFRKDSMAVIELTSYAPNKLTYRSESESDQLAVFSEIYYSKGWKAYIDGKETDHMRANYILRAMKIPAGEHSIEFKFEPRIWKIGNSVSLIGSLIFVVFIIGGILLSIRKNKSTDNVIQ